MPGYLPQGENWRSDWTDITLTAFDTPTVSSRTTTKDQNDHHSKLILLAETYRK